MTLHVHRLWVLLSLVGWLPFAGWCQSGDAAAAKPSVDKAEAYYHFAMGHLYAEQAMNFGNRGDYLNKAIEHYKQAMKADPNASFLAEELSDLYLQSGRLRDVILELQDNLRQNPNDLNSRRILGRIYTRMLGDASQGRVNTEMLKRAIEQYQFIASAEPKNVDVWIMLGRLYKLAQDSVEAEKAYKKATELEPDNEDALTGLGMLYSDLGDTKTATEVLRRVAEKNPSPRSWMTLAGAYEQMRDYRAAASALAKALEMNPGNVDLKRALAQDLLLSDQFDQALKLYEELAREDPKDAQNFLRMSQIYRQQRNFAKAREANERARKIEPNNLEIRFNEVNLLEAEGKTAEAIEALKDMLNSTAKKSYNLGEKNNRAALLERLGMLYRSADNPEEAAKAFRQMAELDPAYGPRAASQIIETYRLARDYAKAQSEANAAKNAYPSDRGVTAVRAGLLAELGKTDEAVKELKSLLDGKGDREVYLSIAQAYERAKRFDEMAKALDEAEKLSTTPEEKEAIYFARGAMYERQKKYDLSEAEFRKVLAMNPNNASALNYLGYMFADRNVRLQEALELVQKALDREPDNAAYLDSLGWVYFRMGKLKEAEDYIRKSLQRSPRDATVHDHLGDILWAQGRVREAIAQWQAALKEFSAGPPSEADPAEIAKINRKIEGARVRLAREAPATAPKH